MAGLTDKEKQLLKEGKQYLEKNDIEGFYDYIIKAGEHKSTIVRNITKFLLKNKINPLKYCKTKIPFCMFYGTNITVAPIPYGVKNIGVGAFADCSKLNSVTIPDTVEEIDGLAFEECTSLTTLHLPSSIYSIRKDAFLGNPDLVLLCEFDPRKITWPDWDKYNIEKV